MGSRIKLLENVRNVLSERFFTAQQIEKIIPRLHQEIIKEPKYLAEIVDTWNIMMSSANLHDQKSLDPRSTPPLAHAPKSSLMGSLNINMNIILGDIEPDLLLFDPKKLLMRHSKIQGLGFAKNLGEQWLILYNAPRGFYLQDWLELSKKIYYIEHHILDFLYDKKDQKSMEVHPLVKSAASIEANFDHIRTRYLFALRSGYKSLSHMYSVQMALDRPTLKDIILSDNETFLSKFSPFCSLEEYCAFSNLIKNHDFDEDDAQIFEKLAELSALSSQN